jgi:hypothetical protein
MMQGCSDENMRCWHFSYLSGYPAEVRKTRVSDVVQSAPINFKLMIIRPSET